MNHMKPILLVEDDDVDAMTVERALSELKIANELVLKSNGVEAMKYLSDENNRKPCVILLDLNMPKMNGIEFLKIIKKDRNFKKIPVVALTTSKEDKDKLESFKLGIAGYMVKAVDYKEFVEVVRAIDLYWTLSEFSTDKMEKRAEDAKLESNIAC
jgi:CheY-like chemotaxis protein